MTLIPGVTVFVCPKCGRDVSWMTQDAPSDHQERMYDRARRFGLKVEQRFEGMWVAAEWCTCEKGVGA